MKRHVPALFAALLLAACSSGESTLAPPCPTIVIVQELASLTQFKPGEGRDLTDVVLEGKITGFDGFCETDLDKDIAQAVEVELRVVFTAARGPANTDRKGSYSYFVALADREGDTVQKHVFDSTVEFPGNRNRVAPFEELTLKVPLKPGESGANYTVYVGFQLTPEQLDYNRTSRTR
jgi:hypothetical protein